MSKNGLTFFLFVCFCKENGEKRKYKICNVSEYYFKELSVFVIETAL